MRRHKVKARPDDGVFWRQLWRLMSSTSPMSASAGGGNGNRRRGVFSLGKCRLPVVGSPNVQQQHLIDSNNSGGGVRAVKYTPRGHPLQQQADTSLLHGYSHANSRDNEQQDDELEEIAVVSVVSGVQSGQLTYGSAGSSMANGPRVVPGKRKWTALESRKFLVKSRAKGQTPEKDSAYFADEFPWKPIYNKPSTWASQSKRPKRPFSFQPSSCRSLSLFRVDLAKRSNGCHLSIRFASHASRLFVVVSATLPTHNLPHPNAVAVDL